MAPGVSRAGDEIIGSWIGRCCIVQYDGYMYMDVVRAGGRKGKGRGR